ncbi:MULTISPECIES: DUF2339 domain-containing protein [Lysinibacillus]|uniref:DUF2339 domain-containing protein n=1 Tax=Lysinibacillus TaxID=400634 RepID=UPI00088CC1F7|nr:MULTISPECIES: DUF2339 domain-containing protein [unclassified Lysinibacillus]MEE3807148.1 DUF2339 domain-containing protein [Lysinibacillus fusiformis]SCX88837.1 Predicted membrane protein [Lysinibacillus sp. SG9]SDB05777.1 Predicted membrane protein [Lysinibacillus sp. TC-37]SFS36362.1 Predicted membrane protein [Lysinibacillus sp. SG55]
MSLELERRIAKLEEEMADLRQELSSLKGTQSTEKINTLDARQSMIKQSEPIKPKPALESKPVPTKVTEKEVQPQPSMEERVMWALPKVFMVILVMGVLWGLKLVSDYGYLSNGVKIILAYALSVGLAVIAYVLERRKVGSSAITISLYGGAFIVGILTTAASAILYEIIGLTPALGITLLYIGYGIAISYWKKNEVLTVFVAFTSLLLPYLLEYMDFNAVIILLFVVILFASLQWVIYQHKQKLALYIATFFSVLAVSVVAFMNIDKQVIFAFGLLVILSIFYVIWCLMYNAQSKWKPLHIGLQFSLGSFSLLLMNLIIRSLPHGEMLLLVLMALFGAVALYSYRQKWQEVLDSAVTLAFITLCNTILLMNIPNKVDDLLYPMIAFAGVMMSLRLRASMMKVVSSFVLIITFILNFIFHEPKPFFSIDHLSLFMPIIYFVIIYLYARRPKETLTTFEKVMKDLYVIDILAVATTGYFLAYIGKLDTVYFAATNGIPYMMCIVLAALFTGSLFVEETYKGRALTPVLGSFFLLFFLMISTKPTMMESLNIITRLVYMAVIVAIIVDILVKGFIYRLYEVRLGKYVDAIVSTGIVLTMISIWGLIHQFTFNNVLDWKLSIALTTITLFLTASVSLWISSTHQLKTLRSTGFILLVMAFIKLIFFDLSALDLLIRAILFITIGGIGMLLSGRLLKK